MKVGWWWPGWDEPWGEKADSMTSLLCMHELLSGFSAILVCSGCQSKMSEWLEQQKFISNPPGCWEVHGQGSSQSGSWWEFSSQLATFSWCRHAASPQCVWRSLSSSSPYKAPLPIMRPPPSWPVLTLVTSQMSRLQKTPPYEGLGIQHMYLGVLPCSVAQSCPTLCNPMDCSLLSRNMKDE